MGTCKAIIQEGSRRGESCKFPATENLYCGRHQRNYLHEKLITEGKRPCRFYYRGCDNLLELTDISSCKSCRESLSTKNNACKHEGCKFKTNNEKYCKKHERDKYYDEEKEKGIKYCDVSRGCFTICENGLKSCRECLDNEIVRDKQKYDKTKSIHNALAENKNTIYQICCNCGMDFEKFMTGHNCPSKKCKICQEKQNIQDQKRKDRVRNYKNENLKNLKKYFKQYISGALKRNYAMDLQFDDFEELVKKPCYYCDYKIDDEINGIDRVDNTKGYTKENCVPCCEICNRIKLIYHPLFFIEKCQIISKQKEVNEEYYKSWDEYYYIYVSQSYSSYKKQSETKREIKFNITIEQWNTLKQQSCYLCGYKNIKGIGLDRVDNTIREYTIENVKPCCGSCNVMKKELTVDEFLKKAQQVATKWKDTSIFQSIPKLTNEIVKTTSLTNRINWKSLGVYNSILNKSNEFYESQKEFFTEAEFHQLKQDISTKTKDESIQYIKCLLTKLNKRRKRSKTQPD